MIDFVSGSLVEKQPTHVVIQVGGIGLRIPITLSAFDRLPDEGAEAKLPATLIVREDSLTLYGFSDPAERQLFEQLIQVSGIGPKIAMTALSGLPGTELSQAIRQSDTKRLSGISGIGKKMAERMVVELKDKLGPSLPDSSASTDEAPKGSRDAVLALIALGYKQQEARKLLEKIPATEQRGLPVEELVRRALRPR